MQQLNPAEQMTIEEFLAMMARRPDGERWELIEGVAVMNPSPTSFHQIIAGNIYMALGQQKIRSGAHWTPLLGIGTRVPVSPNSLPQPDVQVLEGPAPPEPSSITDDALVLFEVLSSSNSAKDRAWRKRVYASIANCQHYVTVSSLKVEAVRYDRSGGWKARKVTRLGGQLALPALGCELPMAEIYRWTPLGAGAKTAR